MSVLESASPALRTPAERASLAYLVSTYPTLSMTFVLREVLGLRKLGFRIETASINPPDRPSDKLTAAEAKEAQNTYCIKRHGAPGAITAHLQALLRQPGGYLRGLRLAFRLAHLDLHKLFFNLMYLTEALMVGRWMRQKRLTHLHVHLASQAASVGLFVRTAFGFGYSLTVHGPDEFYDARGHYLAEKIAAADFLCCISSFARSQLMQLSPYEHWGKFHVVRLGVDPNLFAPQPERSAPACFEVLCVGRLTPAKGQHLLIDAIHKLVLQGRKVRLRLVGSGPDEASLRAQVGRLECPDCIVFEGAVNQDRIRALYAAADVFCLPSFAEGIPVVLMEAMSMEIPCVSTHITGIPELIRNGVDGMLVAPSDREALAEAVARLMDNPIQRKELGRNGRARVLALYDLPGNLEKLATLFLEQLEMSGMTAY